METIRIVRTRKGHAAYWVGGGAFTKTYSGVFVILGKPIFVKELGFSTFYPAPIFLKKSGSLACSNEQALVPLNVGDIIVEANGHRPADMYGSDIDHWIAKKVIAIRGEEAEVERLDICSTEEVYASVEILAGLNTYHNRDGGQFCFIASRWKDSSNNV